MSERVARRWRVGAWIVATGLVVALFRTVDTERFLRVVARTDIWWLAAAVMVNLAIQPVGALQWWALLPEGITVARRRMLRLFALTSVANNTTPSLIGHATGVLLLAAEPGVGKEAALSVLALDQLAVGVAKVSILVGAASLLPLPTWMTRGFGGLAAMVTALLIAAIVVSTRTRFLAALRSPRRFGLALACALGVKTCEAGAILCVQLAFGMSPTLETVLLVLAATALSSVVPVAPANIGTYEAAAFGAYRVLGLTPEAALGIAVVQHACQLLPAVGAGYVLLSLPTPTLRNPPLRV